MKIIIILVVILVGLSEFAFANQKVEVQKALKINGCYYAGIVYNLDEKHRVQEHILDPATQKMTIRDAQPEVWQECVDGEKDGTNMSSRFYWKKLPEKK